MEYKKDEKIIRKLENPNYKGIKSLATELEEKVKELEGQSAQTFVNDLYKNLSNTGIQRLNKVIENYNKKHSEEEYLKTYSQVTAQYKEAIEDSSVLFLNYGSKYGENHFTDEFIKNQFAEAITSVPKEDMQYVIDEVNKKLQSSMKTQGTSAVDETKTKEAFSSIVRQYGEEHEIRTRISDFTHAEAQADRLMDILKISDDEKEGLTDDEISSMKSKKLHSFKYSLLKMEKTEKPDDFQAIIDILDKNISFDERKALDSAIQFNNKENENKYETRRVRLTEKEKDHSWQKFQSDSVLSKKFREFKEELDELRKNKVRPSDRYDRGFTNGSLRLLINLQKLIEKMANFINDTLKYYLNNKNQKDAKNDKNEKNAEQEQKKLSPFHKLMEEAYWEKGFLETFSYESGDISKEQAESMFIADIAYIKSLHPEQQAKLFEIYANSLMTAMKDERISVGTKFMYQTFIANYERGDYTDRMSKTTDNSLDWYYDIVRRGDDPYINANSELALSYKGLPKEELERRGYPMGNHKKTHAAKQEQSSAKVDTKSTEQAAKADITEVGECIRKTMEMSKDIAYSSKSVTDITEKLGSELESIQEAYPSLNDEQFGLCQQIAAASILTHSKSSKELVDAMAEYNSKDFYAASSRSRVQILLKGAEAISLSGQDRDSNLCQDALHKELKNTIKRLTDMDKQEDFLKSIAENTKSNKQQYILAVEAKSFGFRLESDRYLNTDKQIDKAISSLLNRYSARLDKNNEKISTYERITTLFQMTSSNQKAPGEQRVLDSLQKQLDTMPKENRKEIMQMINKDIEQYNGLCKQYGTPELPLVSQGEKSILMEGLNAAKEEEQQSGDNISVIDIQKETTYTTADIIDAFNRGKDPEEKFNQWIEKKAEEEIRKGILEIDKGLGSQEASYRFVQSLIDTGLYGQGGIRAPYSEQLMDDMEEEYQ